MIEGIVRSLDDHRGDGYFQGDDGQNFYFHCVTIHDGSRRIRVGVRARATRAVGRLGRDEVIDVSPLA